MTLETLPGNACATMVKELVAKQELPNAFSTRIMRAAQKKMGPEGKIRRKL
jgi:hypothetical protein